MQHIEKQGVVAVKTLLVAGARPNFMKIAPIYRALLGYPEVACSIVHTGQHFEENMSGVFFKQLGLPDPAYFLEIRGGSACWQLTQTWHAFEKVLAAERPQMVVVVGDVNATMACARAARNAGIPLAHVEAGLRSGDLKMPEESNRILTDHLSDYLFVTEPSGLKNLGKEGIGSEKVHFVGNCMVDSLFQFLEQSRKLEIVSTLGLASRQYLLATLHRPSNVDTREGLLRIIEVLELACEQAPVVFPMHPRTRKNLASFALENRLAAITGLHVLPPQGYLEFLNLLEHSLGVLTDSGGIQEEATCLGIPCLTFRTTTERPVTIEMGTNELMAELNPEFIVQKIKQMQRGQWKVGKQPDLWDGKAGERIAAVIARQHTSKKST